MRVCIARAGIGIRALPGGGEHIAHSIVSIGIYRRRSRSQGYIGHAGSIVGTGDDQLGAMRSIGGVGGKECLDQVPIIVPPYNLDAVIIVDSVGEMVSGTFC